MADMSGRPLPRRTRDSDMFWDGCRDHRLVLQRCDQCHTFRYHPMPGCRVCGALTFTWDAVEQRGHVANFTVVHADFNPAFETPYALCIVDLECGARMLSRMIDCDPMAVEVGMQVEVAWEDVPAADTSIPAFRPVEPIDVTEGAT